jgi:hypothetical protein
MEIEISHLGRPLFVFGMKMDVVEVDDQQFTSGSEFRKLCPSADQSLDRSKHSGNGYKIGFHLGWAAWEGPSQLLTTLHDLNLL